MYQSWKQLVCQTKSKPNLRDFLLTETKQQEANCLCSGLEMAAEYPEMVAVPFVHARMELVFVRSNSLLLRGSNSHRSHQPLINEGAAMEGLQLMAETWCESFYGFGALISPMLTSL